MSRAAACDRGLLAAGLLVHFIHQGFALTAMAVAAIGRRVFGSVRPEAEPGIVPPAAARTPAA